MYTHSVLQWNINFCPVSYSNPVISLFPQPFPAYLYVMAFALFLGTGSNRLNEICDW